MSFSELPQAFLFLSNSTIDFCTSFCYITSTWLLTQINIYMFDILQQLNLPKSQYVIVGGAVMEALKLKQTSDIDIVVTPQLFTSLADTGEWIVKTTPNKTEKLKKYITNNSIKKVEIYTSVNTETYCPTFNQLLERSVTINKFNFISLMDLLQFKKSYGRAKDYKDIQLIENSLHTS